MVTVTLTTLNLCSCPCSCCPHHITSHNKPHATLQNITKHSCCNIDLSPMHCLMMYGVGRHLENQITNRTYSLNAIQSHTIIQCNYNISTSNYSLTEMTTELKLTERITLLIRAETCQLTTAQPRLAPMLWWHWTLSSALSPLVSATSLDNLAKKNDLLLWLQ